MKIFNKFICILCLYYTSPQLSAQTFYALPIAYYTPETRWGFGLASVFIFSINNDSVSLRKSNINLGAAITQNNQKAFYLPYQLYVNKHKYWLYGEFGYYKYVFDFYGIGTYTKFLDREKYTAKFPRIRWNGLQRLNKNSYLGVRYVLDDFQFTQFDSSGVLVNKQILGSEDGTVSGLGLIYNFDSRDHQFFPTKGSLIEIYLYREFKNLGSDYKFSKLSIDIANYTPIRKNIVWANQILFNREWNEVPFHQLNFVGGNRRLRGIMEGQYRDRNLIMWQTEWRAPLFWKFKYVCFAGAALMGNELAQLYFAPILYSYGVGIRYLISEKQKLNVRMDYAISKQTKGFYFTLAEAF